MHGLALLSWYSLLIYILSPAFALPTARNSLSIYTNPVLQKDSTRQACGSSLHYCSSDMETSVLRRWARICLGNNWYTVYESFTIFLPTKKVVPILETFYLTFRADVTTKWLNTPPVGQLKIRYGMIKLEF